MKDFVWINRDTEVYKRAATNRISYSKRGEHFGDPRRVLVSKGKVYIEVLVKVKKGKL